MCAFLKLFLFCICFSQNRERKKLVQNYQPCARKKKKTSCCCKSFAFFAASVCFSPFGSTPDTATSDCAPAHLKQAAHFCSLQQLLLLLPVALVGGLNSATLIINDDDDDDAGADDEMCSCAK